MLLTSGCWAGEAIGLKECVKPHNLLLSRFSTAYSIGVRLSHSKKKLSATPTSNTAHASNKPICGRMSGSLASEAHLGYLQKQTHRAQCSELLSSLSLSFSFFLFVFLGARSPIGGKKKDEVCTVQKIYVCIFFLAVVAVHL